MFRIILTEAVKALIGKGATKSDLSKLYSDIVSRVEGSVSVEDIERLVECELEAEIAKLED